jgi:hypothetical protein
MLNYVTPEPTGVREADWPSGEFLLGALSRAENRFALFLKALREPAPAEAMPRCLADRGQQKT